MESVESIRRKLKLAYDYGKALERLEYTQEDVDKVRDLVADDKIVPKFLINSFVRKLFNFLEFLR
jgi:hypothetical protein